MICSGVAAAATVRVNDFVAVCAVGVVESVTLAVKLKEPEAVSVPEIVPAEEPEPLGRGGGLRFASASRRDAGDVYALNGDELVDLDLGALAGLHRARAAAATITVVPLESHLGIVDLDEDDLVVGFREKPRLPHWVSCGVYVLGEEALDRLPAHGDHETTTFPALAAERKLLAYRHEGLWLTVNTPKDLRTAVEHVTANPNWPSAV